MKEKNITWKLFYSFFKIGIFTFGGGYAMIPLIEKEVIDNKHWVERKKFLELLTLAQTAPGPISLNTAVFVGYNMNRYLGAAAAVLGTILPSFVIILIIAVYFSDIKDNHIVEAVFKGMRPAVVALIAAPILGLGRGMGAFRTVIALLAAVIVWKFSVSPIIFIIVGAVGGVVWYIVSRKNKDRSSGNK